jgi:hypothetical protein
MGWYIARMRGSRPDMGLTYLLYIMAAPMVQENGRLGWEFVTPSCKMSGHVEWTHLLVGLKPPPPSFVGGIPGRILAFLSSCFALVKYRIEFENIPQDAYFRT